MQKKYGQVFIKLFYEIQPQIKNGNTKIVLKDNHCYREVKKVLSQFGYEPTTKKSGKRFEICKKR